MLTTFRWAPLLFASAFASMAAAQAAPRTELVLVGTGTPVANPRAGGPATAVVIGTRVFLFDAGPGVERNLRAAGLPGIGVTALFFTHLHSDHTLGYPDLIFSSWVMGRRHPFPVYGPAGIAAMTDHLIAAFAQDIDVRTNGLEHESRDGYKVDVHEISAGVVYDSGGVRVTAIPVLHGSWAQSFGYRIDTPDRSIVISGDTRPSDALERAAAGCDILVHEVYEESELKPESRPGGTDWPEYMRAFHTSDRELGALASRANPRLLVLTHIIGSDATGKTLLDGVRAGGFTGQTVIGHDRERF